ncbi:hatching enzyme 1.2 [Neodiprion pinetum]|uniref:hatching enzyme 1.2 n=1 Tax=Neodiprion pinetum TaxID=441929 RepID=UPI001EDCF027|nr:zinc metalloproteinase nas-14 [Neodiprion pinetum]
MRKTALIALHAIGLCFAASIGESQESRTPPSPRFVGVFAKDYDHSEIGRKMDAWKPDDTQNLWELSGLFEGDIMVHPEGRDIAKNGLLEAEARWPRGEIPYHIHEEDFDKEGVEVIKGALAEYHERTCLRFRPYEKSDEDYVSIRGTESGCWSMVGRHGQGQVLNVNNPKCVRHGIVVHELMHALGFYHQQSAADRDDWVEIHWDNIQEGKEHNFKKYDNKTVTDFGIPYDYKSIMHYSSHAFSKNNQPTITPIKEEVKLGQRKGLTKKDIAKIDRMYEEECKARESSESSSESGSTSESSEEKNILGWLFD